MTDCTHNCQSCGSDCKDRKPDIQKAPMNYASNIKKVIGVVSGKGGVGKSSVTSMMAVSSARAGKKVAILDADITGPSIPKTFGLKDRAQGNNSLIVPVVSDLGIKVMSINLLLENETDPVVWRGPVLANLINQFWTNVIWGDIDIMYVDMPPGTGDVALTVYQSLPVDGLIIVTSPQELVEMIVEKAVKMADMMKVPIVGIVENMSFFRCPDCGKETRIFGPSRVDKIAAEYGIKTLTKLPIDPLLAEYCDRGAIETYESPYIGDFREKIEDSVKSDSEKR
jgi:Mrp family chromosome partitioning ATPase